VLEAAGGVEAQIGGGIAEVASALVAVHHLGADEPGIAKELVGFRHPAGGERGADRAGPHRPSRVFEPRHHVDREAELCALRREIIGRPRAIEADMKIKADGDAGDGKAPDQNACNEVLRGKACQRRVEAQHDRAAKPGRGQKPQLRALVGEAEQRLVGAKKTAGMRLEGGRCRLPPHRPGARRRGRDHGAVAAMPAVEIADGDDGAVERVVGGRFAPHHDERFFRRRLVGHDRRWSGPRMTSDGSLITAAPVIASPWALFKQAASYQLSRCITAFGATPAAAKMPDSAAASGSWRSPSSSAWMPAVPNRQTRAKSAAPFSTARTATPIANTR